MTLGSSAFSVGFQFVLFPVDVFPAVDFLLLLRQINFVLICLGIWALALLEPHTTDSSELMHLNCKHIRLVRDELRLA